MPLANPVLRYAVAFATPRDARVGEPRGCLDSRSLLPPTVDESSGVTPFQVSRAWSEPLRTDWLASRLAAKRAATALLAHSGRSAREIEIVRSDSEGRAGHGVLAQQVARLTPSRILRVPLSFSISLAHAEGHAIAAAASHPARIGVDLEREGQIDRGYAQYFLSPRERRYQGRRTLTELWALKESAWKALGCDDATPFPDLELVLDAGGCVRAVRLATMIFPVVAEIRHPWPGWVAAVLMLQGIAA